MKIGDIVRFKDETDEEKIHHITMRILWIDSPRVMVVAEIPGFSIQPTQIVNIDEIEKVNND